MSTAVEAPPAHHPPPTKKRKPSSRACQPCRELHKSCSSERPCQRCVKHGRAHLCVTPAPKPKRSAKMMQLTQSPTTISPALPSYATPLILPDAPLPLPSGNEFLDTSSQIQHLQLQLQQLQKMQAQQQTLIHNPPSPYKFGLDPSPSPSSHAPSPNSRPTPHTPIFAAPLTPNALAQPLTPTLQPLTPQPYLTLPSPTPAGPPVGLSSTPHPLFTPVSPQPPSLEQLAAHYNVRLDADQPPVTLDSETRDFIASALSSAHLEVPDIKLSNSLSDLYNTSISMTASTASAGNPADFDAESLFIQQYATDPVTDDGGSSSDDDAMLTDGNDLGAILSPTHSHHESTTATPVEGIHSASSPLASSGTDLKNSNTINLALCEEELTTPGAQAVIKQTSIAIPRGPLSDADVDLIVDKMGHLTMCPIKAAELAKAQQEILAKPQHKPDHPVVMSCQQKLTEMMWRLADKTGNSQLTPEINTVLHKLVGVMIPKAALFDASAFPYAILVHKFKVTLQMASEMTQPVLLLNGRRHVIYANDHFHNLTGNLFVDTRLYDFEVFHPDDALRYMTFALDKLADRTNNTTMRFKVLSLAEPSGYVQCVVNPHVLFEQLTSMPMFTMVNFTRVDDAALVQ